MPDVKLPAIEDAYEHFVVPNPELYTVFGEYRVIIWDSNVNQWMYHPTIAMFQPYEHSVCTHNDLVKIHLDKINSEEVSTEADSNLIGFTLTKGRTALHAHNLEQQATGAEDFANKYCGLCKTTEQADVSERAFMFCKELRKQARAIKNSE